MIYSILSSLFDRPTMIGMNSDFKTCTMKCLWCQSSKSWPRDFAVEQVIMSSFKAEKLSQRAKYRTGMWSSTLCGGTVMSKLVSLQNHWTNIPQFRAQRLPSDKHVTRDRHMNINAPLVCTTEHYWTKLVALLVCFCKVWGISIAVIPDVGTVQDVETWTFGKTIVASSSEGNYFPYNVSVLKTVVSRDSWGVIIAYGLTILFQKEKAH